MPRKNKSSSVNKYEGVATSNVDTGDMSGYSPSDKEQEAIDFIYERFSNMKAARGGGFEDSSTTSTSSGIDWESVWNDGDKAYRQYQTSSKDNDWRSNIVIPITFSQVEAQLAELEDVDLGIIVRPVEKNDTDNAKVMQHVTDAWWRKGHGDIQFNKTKKSAMTRGTGIGKVIYRVDRKTIKEIDTYDPKTEEIKYSDVTKFEYDDVYYADIDLFNFFIDEIANDNGMESARDCIEREIISIEAFQEKYGSFKNTKYVTVGGDTSKDQFYDMPEDQQKNEVEVLHYYNQLKDLYLIVANNVLLTKYDRPLPWHHKKLPFVRIVDYGLIGEFYGYGEPQILKGLQAEINTIRRMAIDNAHLQINKMFVVSDSAIIDEDALITRPGGVIPLYGDVDKAFRSLDFPPLGSDWKVQYEELRRDVIRAAGFSEELQSVSSSETATQAAILKESSQKRIKYKNKFFKKMGLVPVGEFGVALVQQFYSKPKVVQIVGDDGAAMKNAAGENVEAKKFRTIRVEEGKDVLFFEVTPDMIRGNFDILVDAENIIPISKALERQQEMQLFEINMKNPAIDLSKATQKLYEAFNKNPYDYMAEATTEGTNDEEQIRLAYEHHDALVRGNPAEPSKNPTEVHLGAHEERVQKDAARFANDRKLQDLYAEHVNAEMQLVQGGQKQGMSTTEQTEQAVGASRGAPRGNSNAVKGVDLNNLGGGMNSAEGSVASQGTTLARGQV